MLVEASALTQMKTQKQNSFRNVAFCSNKLSFTEAVVPKSFPFSSQLLQLVSLVSLSILG